MPDGILPVVAFAGAASLALLVALLVAARPTRLDHRLDTLARPGDGTPDPVAEFARAALPKMGTVLMPQKEDDRTKLQTRLVHAGLYSRQAMVLFLGVKLVLMVGPVFVGVTAGVLGVVPLQMGILVGAIVGGFGMIGPSFWLDQRKAVRQMGFRRALPDAMDVLVICLEGGSSLAGAIRRVTAELRTAHPLLAAELRLVEREIQLGRSPGEAFREFANRTDLEEVRGLAAVILQAERFGASLVKALKVHAETMRGRRVLFAEEMAQKAVVKILFPTILFIMPAMFIVILGPIGIMIAETFDGLKK